MSVPHRRPLTWRLAPSPLPSPSQRPRCHPAHAAALTAPPPRLSPLKLLSSFRCQRSVPERSPLRRPWPYPIRGAEIPSSNCPAFSPGTPARSLNESTAVPLANDLDLWISRGWLPSTSHNAPHTPQPRQLKWSRLFTVLVIPAPPTPPQQTPGVTGKPTAQCLYRYRKAAWSPRQTAPRGVKVSYVPVRVWQTQLEVHRYSLLIRNHSPISLTECSIYSSQIPQNITLFLS